MEHMKRKTEIDKLEREEHLEREEWIGLLTGWDEEDRAYAGERARGISHRYFGNRIYVRGLIEFTSYCRNDCYYCGLRRSNTKACRYRLPEAEILSCCEAGYGLGFRTFVLQGGEDSGYTEDRMIALIRRIKALWPDCALTLSVGEWEEEAYRQFYEAGADRYLLRHETADSVHYGVLHPSDMSLAHRIDCLQKLKAIGYQTGCGFMVGAPGQTGETLAKDMSFIEELHPHMAGIGPFIPHRDTPFGKNQRGSYKLTLFLLSLLWIMEKNILLPATTALGTICDRGREEGVLAGANVIMPNLSPVAVREKYAIYENKLCTGEEAAEHMDRLQNSMRNIGYEITFERGDWKERQREKGNERTRQWNINMISCRR